MKKSFATLKFPAIRTHDSRPFPDTKCHTLCHAMPRPAMPQDALRHAMRRMPSR
jgi:hypothetical protein